VQVRRGLLGEQDAAASAEQVADLAGECRCVPRRQAEHLAWSGHLGGAPADRGEPGSARVADLQAPDDAGSAVDGAAGACRVRSGSELDLPVDRHSLGGLPGHLGLAGREEHAEGSEQGNRHRDAED
jgi:hypothetical protein